MNRPKTQSRATNQLKGFKMTRIRYNSPPTDELLEKMRRASAIYVYYSTEDQEEAWSSNKGVPRWSRRGSDAHKIERLELIVDSSKQLPEVQALWDAS
jgi:TfoX/Sxy family transcriptional regulator of competence genes